MRICVPSRVIPRNGGFVAYVHGEYGIVGTPINCTYELQDSIFWDEDGKPENQCCHGKYLPNTKLGGKPAFLPDVWRLPNGNLVVLNGSYSAAASDPNTYLIRSIPLSETGGCAQIICSMGLGISVADKRHSQNVSGYVRLLGVPTGDTDGSLRCRSTNWIVLQFSVAGWRAAVPGLMTVTKSDVPGLSPGMVLGIASVEGSDRFDLANQRMPALNQVINLVERYCVQYLLEHPKTGNYYATAGGTAELPRPLKTSDFLLDEYEILSGFPFYSTPNKGYVSNWLKQHAFLDAVESAPKLSDNSISNILEFLEIVNGLVHGKVEIPKRWQDAWLAYRYQYMTTKLDIQEAISFFKRMSNLSSLNAGVKSYGLSSYTVEDSEVVCRCKLDIKPKSDTGLNKLWGHLSRLGLAPDSYVIWDMTPFSFMVDWFVPIGDILEVFDTSVLTQTYWDITNVTYSFCYERDIAGNPAKFYTRWVASPPQSLNSFYWFDRPSSSSKIKLFRILDTASLFIGGS